MLEKFANNEKYLSGEYLVGDDFSQDEISQWYKEEEEAYCTLSNNNKFYLYEKINNFYGLEKKILELKKVDNPEILCFGAAYGGEVTSIISLMTKYNIYEYKITIIDSSSEMLKIVQDKLDVRIIKATIDGKINIDDCIFDLITCFGVLHHIPNVSYVFSELVRILKKDGVFIIREPISSMGNWASLRQGLTINERGLGVKYISKLIVENQLKILKLNYLMSGPCLILGYKIKLRINNIFVVFCDFLVSKLLSFNLLYHRDSILKKIAPGSIFLILKK